MLRALRALTLGAALAASPLAAQVAAPPPPPEPKGWIGISYESEKVQEGLRIRPVSRVVEVRSGSPAAGAGIRVGDVLVSINGRTWEEQYASKGAPAIRAGEPVRLVVDRGGRQQEIRLVAGRWPEAEVAAQKLEVMVMPDSIVERLYLAMDSLRVRIVADEGLRQRITELNVAADSMMDELARERVVYLRRTLPGQAVPARPLLVTEPGAPPGPPWPFAVRVLADSTRDSLWVSVDRGTSFRWSAGESAPQVLEFRPTVPYVLGENRAAGAEVVELRPELAEYFHVHGGVLVVDVAPGTPAAKAGIQPGDVLTHVDGTLLRSIADLRRGLIRATGETRLTLVRQGRTVEVRLGG